MHKTSERGRQAPWAALGALAGLVFASAAFPAAPPLRRGNVATFAEAHWLEGQEVVIRRWDGSCCVYDLGKGRPLYLLAGKWYSARYSRAQRALLVCGPLGPLMCWDPRLRKRRWVTTEPRRVNPYSFNKDELVMAAPEGVVYRLDWKTGKVKSRATIKRQPYEHIEAVAISPDGRAATGSLLGGGLLGTACGRLVADGPGRPERLFDWDDRAIEWLEFAMGGKRLVSLNREGRLKVWRVGPAFPERKPQSELWASSYSVIGGGSALAVGQGDGTLLIHSLATGKALARRRVCDYPIKAVAESPDGERLIAVTHKYALSVISRKTLRVERTISAVELQRQLLRLRPIP